jgi:general secretion pathway protein G
MNNHRGFTLIQLVAAVAIVGILSSIAVPSYRGYVERARTARAIGDLGAIQIAIRKFTAQTRVLPASLADVDAGGLEDPWGQPYQYVVLGGLGASRTDHAGDPINTDYDLFSVGPDGDTAGSLTAAESADDIVRGNNGAFLGVVANYPRLPN